MVTVAKFHRECIRVAARLQAGSVSGTVKYVTVTRPGDGSVTASDVRQ